jgi:hypothetical protein
MYQVDVDFDALDAQADEADASLTAQFDEIQRLVDEAAEEERSTDTYQNRTGNLREGTVSIEVYRDDDGIEIQFTAMADYASYVNDKGSMRIDELAAETDTIIQFYLDSEAERLAGM